MFSDIMYFYRAIFMFLRERGVVEEGVMGWEIIGDDSTGV